MGEKRLPELSPGEKGKVVKVTGEGSMHRRILDMGIVRGVEIDVERVAPLGDPMEISLRGYHLSLRKEEAACIIIES